MSQDTLERVQRHYRRMEERGYRRVLALVEADVLADLDELAEQSATSRVKLMATLLRQAVASEKARQRR